MTYVFFKKKIQVQMDIVSYFIYTYMYTIYIDDVIYIGHNHFMLHVKFNNMNYNNKT